MGLTIVAVYIMFTNAELNSYWDVLTRFDTSDYF
jgi:hypothetical protein